MKEMREAFHRSSIRQLACAALAAALTFRKPRRMPTEAAPQRGAAPRRRLQALASHCGRCPCAGFTLQPTRSASASASGSAPASLREGGDALDFWIFGHPVTMSPSPPLHEAGFGATGRPHRYTTYDTEDASRVAALVRGASGGGGSVTIPLKESILPFVDVLTDDARKIGAVNTLTKLEDGSLLGDNTDVRHCNRSYLCPHAHALAGADPRLDVRCAQWRGIANGLLQRAPAGERSPFVEGGVGVVCGAGGTGRAACHALERMGVQTVLLLNPRTPVRPLPSLPSLIL